MNFKMTYVFFVVLLMLIANLARAWEVDWSRRQQKTNTAGSPGSALPSQSSPNVAPPPMETTTSQVQPMNAVPSSETVEPANEVTTTTIHKKYLEGLVQPTHSPYSGDRQEFVILNTGHGFVPSNVRIHKGLHYVVHVVNVNEDKKNVSFMLDAFNQHAATYFGQIRSFNLDPDKEGVFDFQCPETNSTGKLIVFGQGMAPARLPSSQSK